MYLKTLLVLHGLGAIIGFGPTFAYSVLGPLASKEQGPGGLAILRGMVGIERRFVLPIALVVQPVTGALLIFASKWKDDFFSHTWLWVSIVLYVIALCISILVMNPTLHRMVLSAERGGGPEMATLGARSARFSPILTVLTVVIVVLMLWKPGS